MIAGSCTSDPGAHYLQEDHPETIGRSVAAWIEDIESAAREPGRRRVS